MKIKDCFLTHEFYYLLYKIDDVSVRISESMNRQNIVLQIGNLPFKNQNVQMGILRDHVIIVGSCYHT